MCTVNYLYPEYRKHHTTEKQDNPIQQGQKICIVLLQKCTKMFSVISLQGKLHPLPSHWNSYDQEHKAKIGQDMENPEPSYLSGGKEVQLLWKTGSFLEGYTFSFQSYVLQSEHSKRLHVKGPCNPASLPVSFLPKRTETASTCKDLKRNVESSTIHSSKNRKSSKGPAGQRLTKMRSIHTMEYALIKRSKLLMCPMIWSTLKSILPSEDFIL